MVITELDTDAPPRICFYKVDHSTNTIPDKATFTIERAEMLLGCDPKSGTVSFLTNLHLLSENHKPQNKDYSRIVSPSLLVKITVDELKQLQSLSASDASHKVRKTF